MTTLPEKVCVVPFRIERGVVEVLSFRHPMAGCQLIKGTIEIGELPATAASRELREESGIEAESMRSLGHASIGRPPVRWHFFVFRAESLPVTWDYSTADDGGHVFSFFWHPLTDELSGDWHPMFGEALCFVQAAFQCAEIGPTVACVHASPDEASMRERLHP